MEDLISRQAAIDAVNELTKWYLETYHETRPTTVAVIDRLTELPSAQPDVIRCKDCKHYLRPHGCGHIDGMATAQEDGFCSYAERRTDE